MTEGKQVVIVGGGFGGVRAALDLNRLLPREWGITLIDRNPYHGPQPMLFEVAAAYIPTDVRVEFLKAKGAVSVPYNNIFRGKRVKVVRGEVASLSFPEKKVSLMDGRHLAYTHLVLALGSETNYFNIDGMAEGSFSVK